jgi:SAM-dependent methyltransferase
MLETIDYDEHWTQSLATYQSHPTSRHRRRFVMRSLRKTGVPKGTFVFDYGCGPGLLLKEIQDLYRLADSQLGGCDLSPEAIKAARESFNSPFFYNQSFPDLERPIDIAVTTEVIEHTSEYEEILRWLWDHLRNDGILIVTTPGGSMDPPDVYYGHVQHFRLHELSRLLERLGFHLHISRYWGFPFFTLQKWVTKKYFFKVRDGYMDGDMSTKKRMVFTLAYYIYMVHDLIPYGPQIFLLARKTPHR